MITPLDIRQQKFRKALRGYDVDEVRAFLQNLSQEWERLLEENRILKDELTRAQTQLADYQKMEELLQRTLLQAEETSQKTLENAKKEAAIIIKEAQQKAQKLLNESQEQYHKLQIEIQQLQHKRREILEQLQLFLQSQLQQVRSYVEQIPKESPPEPQEKKLLDTPAPSDTASIIKDISEEL